MSITMGQLASRYAAAASKAKQQSTTGMATLAQVGVGLVKREIQAAHAVDTSAMLNSTTAEKIGPTTYLIGPTVEYATYVALGTSRVAARPFHTKAASKLGKEAAKIGFDIQKLGI